MDRKRSIALATIALGLALGSGNLLQEDQSSGPIVLPPPQELAKSQPQGDASPVSAVAAMKAAAKPQPAPAEKPAPIAAQISHVVPVAAVSGPAPEAPPAAADACAPVLDLIAEPDAMIGITLIAPCQPDARVVLSHAGLTVTARATATGSVFTSIPALDDAGEVTVLFPDGSRATATVAIADLAGLDRFAVQWQADDALSLNAFADGAGYGDAGHATATPFADLAVGDSVVGKVMSFGDATVALPLMAQVYTFPAGDRPALTVEAEVTATTCGREVLGETLESSGGRVEPQELTLPMPECDALGQFLVLNIPAPDLTLAAAD